MLLIKNDEHIGFISDKNSWGGCHHFLLVYDASKLSTVYVVKSPSEGNFPEKSRFFSEVKI